MRLFLALAWFIFLLWAMLSPGDRFPEVDVFDFQDKLIHWLVFVIQTYLWSGVKLGKGPIINQSQKEVILFLVFGLSTGIILEYAQQFIPFRSFDYWDMITNVIGSFSGFLIYRKWQSIKFILE
ncbi:VanZ family protein [Algoriphagus taiwanensis]